jgi:hypothetical protein
MTSMPGLPISVLSGASLTSRGINKLQLSDVDPVIFTASYVHLYFRRAITLNVEVGSVTAITYNLDRSNNSSAYTTPPAFRKVDGSNLLFPILAGITTFLFEGETTFCTTDGKEAWCSPYLSLAISTGTVINSFANSIYINPASSYVDVEVEPSNLRFNTYGTTVPSNNALTSMSEPPPPQLPLPEYTCTTPTARSQSRDRRDH